MTTAATATAPAPARGPFEHRWPAIAGVLAVLILWLLLPSFFLGPLRWVAAGVCALLVIPLIVLNPHHLVRQTTWSRWLSLILGVLLLLVTQALLVQLVFELLTAPDAEGISILLAALQLWVTNAIAFGLLYWELDLGGPVARARGPRDVARADFVFPQDTAPGFGTWRPRYFDYLYISLTAGMAFSPADAPPITRRAKAFMGVEALAGFIMSVLVIARAVSAIT
jgi:uncharacterized membrane protein